MPLTNLPRITYRELFQIGLLLLCVPVQYLLSSSPQSDADKTQALVRLLHDMKELKESWFSVAAYKSLWYNVVAWFTQVLIAEPLTSIMYATIAEDETPAYEVLRYRQDNGHFAMSPVPRTVRPRHLKYRIGQVVRHRSEGYVGVIIGWDAKAMAPGQWLAREYGERQAHRHFPHYAVLVDERDPIWVSAMSFEASYVVQQDLEVVTNTEVQHTHLNNFFSAYDGAQYIPQHWLKKLYPKD